MTLFEDVNKAMTGRVALLSEAEAELFCRMTAIPGDYVDMGTLWGGTAILAALAKKEVDNPGKVYTIDFMKGGYWETGDPSVGLQKPTEAAIHKNIAAFGLGGDIEVIKANSHPWPLSDDVKPTSVLIDCDHKYDGCLRDWLKVKSLKPLFVAFHDYNHDTHPGVAQVVDEVAKSDDKYRVSEQAGTLIVFELRLSAKPVEHIEETIEETEFKESPWESFTVAKLKDELRKHDLPISGNKGELIERLEINVGYPG